MLAVESTPQQPFAEGIRAPNAAEAARLSVPSDVAKKYDVMPVASTVEQLLADKMEEAMDKEEAFYIIDLGVVTKKYVQWAALLPRVKPFFAIKCNPNPAIIRTLASFGANFDCASKAEIQQVLGSGVAASRIIYANPTKMKTHIAYAKSSGVEMMTFDNADELVKIAEVYPTAKLVLRIITDDSQSVCRFSTKFGTPLDQTLPLLARAKELNLNVVGVSFHVGSGCMSVRAFESAIRSAHNVFRQARDLGFTPTLLDLGGGWPGTDVADINADGHAPHLPFSEIANSIRPLLDELFPVDSGVELIAEPGRYFVAESHTLAVNVFAKRSMLNTVGNNSNATTSEDKCFLYYVNDGVYQSFNCKFFDHYSPKPLVFNPKGRTQQYKCTIFGPTCDSMDCIAKDIALPELEVGEWLYFKNMGAYTVAAASPFNGFRSCPTTYYVESRP